MRFADVGGAENSSKQISQTVSPRMGSCGVGKRRGYEVFLAPVAAAGGAKPFVLTMFVDTYSQKHIELLQKHISSRMFY